MSKTIVGYWFAAEAKLPHGDNRAVVIGETLHVEPPLVMCRHGLHASREPFDALQYAQGNLIYKVRLHGDLLEDSDKVCATKRTALAVFDAEDLLRSFARQQALSVAHLWDMPKVVREYLETGYITLRKMAREAARAAATEAARAAAWAAAAAATEAAWAATEAATEAARAAARAAARISLNSLVYDKFAEIERNATM